MTDTTRLRTDPFYLLAALYLSVGFLAVLGRLSVDAGLVDALPRLRWATIHLVTIGSLTSALFGTLPRLADVRPSTRSRWRQWLLLHAGFPLVLLGMVAATEVAVAGATLVLAALVLLGVSVLRAGDGTLGRYYRTAPWFLAVGILAAFGMLLGVHGPGGYVGSLEAHVHANVWGFLALVVAATLLRLLPALVGTGLQYPRLVPVTYGALALGAAGLVAGPWLAASALTISGLLVYVVGTVALLANVVGTARAAGRLRDARLGHVLGAYLWLLTPVPVAPFVLLFPDLVPGAAIERAAITGLVFGWMLQLAMAFLPGVVAAGKEAVGDVDALAAAVVAHPGRPPWLGVLAVNAGLALVWLAAVPVLSGVADAFRLAGFALVAVAWGPFLVRLWRAIGGERAGSPPERPALDPTAGD